MRRVLAAEANQPTARAHTHMSDCAVAGKLPRAFGLLMLATYTMGVMNCVADERALGVATVPLRDTGFDLFTEDMSMLWLLDAIGHLQYVLVVLQCAVLRRPQLLAIFLQMHAAVLFLRCLTVAATTLPSPIACPHTELINAEREWNIVLRPLLHFARSDTFVSWCHDFMFSGHAALMLLASLFIAYVNKSRLWTGLSCSLTLAGSVVLLVARAHYTVDVVVAYIVVSLLFANCRPWINAAASAASCESEPREEKMNIV